MQAVWPALHSSKIAVLAVALLMGGATSAHASELRSVTPAGVSGAAEGRVAWLVFDLPVLAEGEGVLGAALRIDITGPEVDEDDETGADVRRLCYRSGGASSPPAGELDACASGTGATGIGPGGPGSVVLDILATVRDAYRSQLSAVWIATAPRNNEAPPGESWATIVSEGAAVLTLRTMRTCSVDGVNCLGTLGSGRSMLTSAKPRVVPTPIPNSAAAKVTEGVFPNPFNGEVVVRFVAPARGDVSIRVFDIRGRQVYVASLGAVNPGSQDWRWSGTDQRGTTLASGIYAVRIDGAAWARTWKVMLAK